MRTCTVTVPPINRGTAGSRVTIRRGLAKVTPGGRLYGRVSACCVARSLTLWSGPTDSVQPAAYVFFRVVVGIASLLTEGPRPPPFRGDGSLLLEHCVCLLFLLVEREHIDLRHASCGAWGRRAAPAHRCALWHTTNPRPRGMDLLLWGATDRVRAPWFKGALNLEREETNLMHTVDTSSDEVKKIVWSLVPEFDHSSSSKSTI